MNFQEGHGPGGVRLAAFEMPGSLSTCVGLWIPTGARHESAKLSGGFHFLEHMLFKGTARRNAFRLSAAVEEVGGYINAFTAEDHTCIYAQASARHLPRLIDVITDKWLNPTFPAREVERERSVIREEIQMVVDQPAQHVEELLGLALYGRHPLGRPITGTLESVDGITRDDLVDLHKRSYLGGGLVLAAAGAVTLPQLSALLESGMGGFRLGKKMIRPQKWKGKNGNPEPVRIDDGRSEQTHLALGFHTHGRRERERYALRILSVALGETMSSRLFQKLRERRGHCYSVNSSVNAYDETGALVFDAAMDPSRIATSVASMIAELESIAEKGLTKREFNRAREFTLGQLDLHLESPYNFMTWMGESLLAYDRIVPPEESRAGISAATPEEVQQIAHQCLNPENRALAVVGPNPGLEQLTGLLFASADLSRR